VSVLTDLLTLAAPNEANQDGGPQRTLREECLKHSGPRIAHDAPRANSDTAGRSACALDSAAPRALDA
jgi:hypothetical protein